MSRRYRCQPFTSDLVEPAADLLAARHRADLAACPALDPTYTEPRSCVPLVAERLAQPGSLGAVAFSDGEPRGFVLMTPRSEEMWGANAWAEDDGSAGDGEAIREAYAAIAGQLVDSGRAAHWAMVPADNRELVEAWFSLGFGVQHDYAVREPVGADFEPHAGDGLVIRRATADDVAALAELDLVLPTHTRQSPVFSRLAVPTLKEATEGLAEDIADPKFAFWVAEHDGRLIGTLVGTSLANTSSWGALMRPRSAAFLGYAATLPDARGLGAGRALSDAFKAWARDEGYEWLVSDWRSANLEANRTWRAMGFRPHYRRLHRAIL